MLASKHKALAFIILAVPFFVHAQDQCATAPAARYELTAVSGSPVPLTNGFSYTLKNDSDVLIRLKDINPYATKCSVATSTADYKETAVASFLGIIGGVASGVGGSGGASVPPITLMSSDTLRVTKGPLSQTISSLTPCQQQYFKSPVHDEAQRLESLRLSINNALQATQRNQEAMLAEFNDRVHGLVELRVSAQCSDTIRRAQDLMARPLFNIEGVAFSPAPLPLDQAIDQVTFQAQALIGHLNEGLIGSCKAQEARPYIDEDAAFLSALVVGTSASPSAVEKWRSQLKALNTVHANIVNAQNSIAAVLGNRTNFTIDTSIHGNQQTVTYTATCNPVSPQNIAAPDPAAAASIMPAPPATPPATGGGTTPATLGNTWKHEFKFGSGPRFIYAGGVVISPLQQVTFSTTATPGGSGATANTIIRQQNSDTRILPIAMLHARYWDQLPAKGWYAWVPNYFSAGVTAKSSDNKGTNIEYLFGPAWSFAERQIFITAGGYAGQQQRLANSLTVGSTTSLSSANLPITQTTIWKVGFAITWAPAGK